MVADNISKARSLPRRNENVKGTSWPLTRWLARSLPRRNENQLNTVIICIISSARSLPRRNENNVFKYKGFSITAPPEAYLEGMKTYFRGGIKTQKFKARSLPRRNENTSFSNEKLSPEKARSLPRRNENFLHSPFAFCY